MFFIKLVESDSFLVTKLRNLCHVGESTQMSIMKQNNMMILSELEIKLNVITFVESSLDTSKGIFWKDATVASVSDD